MSAGTLLEKAAGLELEPAPERRSRRLPMSPWHLVLAPVAAVMLIPLAWVVITSIETPSEAQRFPPVLIPSGIHLHNYAAAVNTAPFGHFFLNSGIYATVTVLSNVLLCSMAAYAFARIRFFGSGVLFITLLATLMVPFQVVMIPIFLIVRHLGLVDSVGALILPNAATAFGIFFLRQFFRTLPIELEDAARIDGTSRLGVLFKIVLPLSMPALATLGIIQFMWSWNDFLWPLIVINTPDHMPLQVGLSTFQGQHSTEWTLLMAGTVLSQLPMFAVFLLAQRWFVRSIAFTGVK
jgi:multiple sugar transport system permease protein